MEQSGRTGSFQASSDLSYNVQRFECFEAATALCSRCDCFAVAKLHCIEVAVVDDLERKDRRYIAMMDAGGGQHFILKLLAPLIAGKRRFRNHHQRSIAA